MVSTDNIPRISDTIWEIPVSFKEGMRVPACIYATEKLLREMDTAVYDQITNVAMLPGIAQYACCMPDGHFGYGFPSGGIYVRTASWPGLAEEAGGAYKSIDDVIAATDQAGLSKCVVRFTPIGDVKG